jgi:osmotically-inducible protein OsmY
LRTNLRFASRHIKKDFVMIKTSQKLRVLILASVSLVTLSGCVGAAVGVGAAAGVAAAREGGFKKSITDESIRLTISDLWFRRSTEMFRKLDLTVNQGRVLITGVVQKPEDRVEAVRLAWQAKGVKQVINEIRVGDEKSIQTIAQDNWISAELRTRLTFDRDVQSINYSIETVQGTVFMMGVAQNQAELDRAIQIARRIKGVKEVVSYVKLVGEPVPNERAAARRQMDTGAVPSSSFNAQPLSPLPETDRVMLPPEGVMGAPSSVTPMAVEKQTLPP